MANFNVWFSMINKPDTDFFINADTINSIVKEKPISWHNDIQRVAEKIYNIFISSEKSRLIFDKENMKYDISHDSDSSLKYIRDTIQYRITIEFLKCHLNTLKWRVYELYYKKVLPLSSFFRDFKPDKDFENEKEILTGTDIEQALGISGIEKANSMRSDSIIFHTDRFNADLIINALENISDNVLAKILRYQGKIKYETENSKSSSCIIYNINELIDELKKSMGSELQTRIQRIQKEQIL